MTKIIVRRHRIRRYCHRRHARLSACPVQAGTGAGPHKLCDRQGVRAQPAAGTLPAHVTRAYEWANPPRHSWRVTVRPGECMNEGLRVETDGFRSCVGREIDARSDLLILGDDQSGQNVAKAD